MDATALSPAQQIVARKLREARDDGFTTTSAINRITNELGLPRDRVLKVWIMMRLEENWNEPPHE